MKRVLFIAFILLAITFKGFGQTIDKISAVVGDAIILQSDLESQYAQYLAQGGKLDENIKCYLLQQMLGQKLLYQQALLDSVNVNDTEVEDQIKRRMRTLIQRAGGQEKLEHLLSRSIIQYENEMRPIIKEQLIANLMQEKIAKGLSITPGEVKNFFKQIPKDSLPDYPAEVELGVIVIGPKLTKLEKQSFYDKAEALRLRIRNGESFETLARLYSEDPGTASEGGDLGYFDKTMMTKEFTDMAYKLSVGDLSPVFETNFGFHIMQVMDRQGDQVRARHILIKVQPTSESLARAKRTIDSVYQEVAIGKLSFAEAASVFSDDRSTKYRGGMIPNPENLNARTIPVSKLDQQLLSIVDTMQIGSFSKPQIFKDAESNLCYRFLYLKSKSSAHRANLEQDFPRIQELALEEKGNRMINAWFKKHMQDTYVKIDPEYASCPGMKIWMP